MIVMHENKHALIVSNWSLHILVPCSVCYSRLYCHVLIHDVSFLQVGFLVGICLPCYELLAQVLPQTEPMVEGARLVHLIIMLISNVNTVDCTLAPTEIPSGRGVEIYYYQMQNSDICRDHSQSYYC